MHRVLKRRNHNKGARVCKGSVVCINSLWRKGYGTSELVMHHISVAYMTMRYGISFGQITTENKTPEHHELQRSIESGNHDIHQKPQYTECLNKIYMHNTRIHTTYKVCFSFISTVDDQP